MSFCGDQALPFSWKACLAFATSLAGVNLRISRTEGQSCLDCIFQNPVNSVDFHLLLQVSFQSLFSCPFTMKMKYCVFSAGHSDRSFTDESM